MGKNSRIGFGVIKAGFRCRKMLLQEGMSSWASLENHLRSRSGVDGESRGREAGGLARCLGPTAPPTTWPWIRHSAPRTCILFICTMGVMTQSPATWGG